ncbi:MAG: hypothetical protein JF630_05615, partial [Geodermatophilales bacterium]|nr:hypothetical protein [Geodermatophilales bacterium]
MVQPGVRAGEPRRPAHRRHAVPGRPVQRAGHPREGARGPARSRARRGGGDPARPRPRPGGAGGRGGLTATLTVTYRRPVPLGVPLLVTAETGAIDGRRTTATARLVAEDDHSTT